MAYTARQHYQSNGCRKSAEHSYRAGPPYKLAHYDSSPNDSRKATSSRRPRRIGSDAFDFYLPLNVHPETFRGSPCFTMPRLSGSREVDAFGQKVCTAERSADDREIERGAVFSRDRRCVAPFTFQPCTHKSSKRSFVFPQRGQYNSSFLRLA